MIGTQRSGSNLLRVMLNQLPQLYAPHPPHVIQVFAPLIRHYGNLDLETNFKKLIDHVCTLIELNPVSWQVNTLNRDQIFMSCRRNTLLEIFIQINELVCKAKNKTAWCCKSLETVYYIEHFRQENFHPFVIYLYRDGRDVAASFKKVMIGDKHVYHLAHKWKQEQEIALRYINSLTSEKYIALRYEDFILNPEKYLIEICNKTGLQYNHSAMLYYLSDESIRTAQSGKMWENVTKPVETKNTRKFLTELTQLEIELFEFIAGPELQKLGYELTSSGSPLSELTKTQIKLFDLENDRLKNLATENADGQDKEKRMPQAEFLKRIKAELIQ